MKLIAIGWGLALAGIAHAKLPVGNFNQPHDPQADALWAIKPAGKGYTFQQFAYGPQIPAHRYSLEERKYLWNDFYFGKSTLLYSECIGSKNDVICYVPPVTQKDRDYSMYRDSYVRFHNGDWSEIARTSNPLGNGASKTVRR